ncbi:predicted CoA-binding protein [Longilinea arvoryzae]|uniref:Predicted CoA-binding protein n=1 Tax=Longilinea arvoryzae TaxID=360412 RepID=A0A0K8MXS7_9CHLR|nr:CoA-binding protein [Longilinea arvoryzae]GAP16059.1 predicted CoA-binding protein [Longilinea arvoryzae]
MDPKIQDFLQAKHLAVVGVSRSPQKFGTAVYTELKARGFDVYGVNPNMDTINGDPCYKSLTELAGRIDGAVICLHPQQAAAVIREAAAAGITRIWVQQGAQSLETAKAAREAGVTPIEGKCILMYAGQVNSVHAFHRFFARVFGQY